MTYKITECTTNFLKVTGIEKGQMGKIVKYLLLGMSFSVNLREIFGSESS